MKRKISIDGLILNIIKYAVLILFLCVMLAPFVWMILASVKPTQEEIFAFPVIYFTKQPSLQNYKNMLIESSFWRNILNSVIVSAAAGVLAVAAGSLAAYALARFRFRFKGIVMLFFLFTQLLPMFLLLAPLYDLLSALKLINNLFGLILVYTAMMIPFSVVTLVGFFSGAPKSIEEAAQVDGAGRVRALFTVIVPVILPGIATTFIFAFVNCWNELFAANMFIHDDALKTIPVKMNAFIQQYNVKWGEMAAGTIMSVIPSAVLYIFAQRYFAEGLSAGAVKG